MPISYAPTSWNPVVGCTPVSEGCKNCWAMKLHNQRFWNNRQTGKFLYETRGGRDAIREARRNGNKLPFPPQYDLPFGSIQLLPDRLSEPLHWWNPRTVAVCFMGDLFHEQVPDEFLSRVWGTMADAERHTFLILTKRPERMRAFLLNDDLHRQPYWDYHGIMPLRNVWLGVTAENQRMADERIPLLLDTHAAHRWASLEPLLSAVDLAGYLGMRQIVSGVHSPGLDWVIVGGESGPGHRPMELEWAAALYDQCRAAHVPYYFKQRAASRPGQPARVGALDGAKELPWTR
jgi:protein gp37